MAQNHFFRTPTASRMAECARLVLFLVQAQKAWSVAEIPTGLLDKRDGGSLLNSTSKQSQSTHVGGNLGLCQAMRQPHDITADYNTSPDRRGAQSASHFGEPSISETPSMTIDPNRATSHYKGSA